MILISFVILIACQPIMGYFMPKVYTDHLYLHFLCSIFTHGYIFGIPILLISKQIYLRFEH